MSTKIYNLNSGDWVTTIGDVKRPLFNQVFRSSDEAKFITDSRVTGGDGIESVFVRDKSKDSPDKLKNKQKAKKKKLAKRTRTAPKPPVSMVRKSNGGIERSYFVPYTTSYYENRCQYKSNAVPKYLNGTVASELKRFPREFWPSRYYSPTPFVASCCTANTHNLFLLKQETFAKIKTAVLPFTNKELNDQSMNSLRSIKRSIEKYWKL